MRRWKQRTRRALCQLCDNSSTRARAISEAISRGDDARPTPPRDAPPPWPHAAPARGSRPHVRGRDLRVERDLVSPSIATLARWLDLMEEELRLVAKPFEYGHDSSLNERMLELTPGERV